MRCPNCGEDVTDDVPFCPHCGHNLESRRQKRKLRFILMDVQDDMRFRHLASAAVITVVIVAVLSVLLALGGNAGDGDGPSDTVYGEPSEDAIIVSDTSFIELSEGFEDGTLSARMESNGQMSIRLSDEASEGCVSYTWILRDEFSNTSQTITKDTPDLTWVSPDLGRYTVTVHCLMEDGSGSVYQGVIDYMGDSHVQYSFGYGGDEHTVYVDVTLGEYMRYAHASGIPDDVRHSPDADDGARFIVTDGSVATLVQRLQTEFSAHYGSTPTDGPEFAEYILCFVQSCFTVGSDTYYHSASVYWAFPAETLYMAVGDSGDLAVLAASLLSAAGYDAGIAVVNGHGFAAVSLDGYSPSTVPDGCRSLTVSQGGVRYLICEVSDGHMLLGCVDGGYGYSNGHFTYYGSVADEGSGLVLA